MNDTDQFVRETRRLVLLYMYRKLGNSRFRLNGILEFDEELIVVTDLNSEMLSSFYRDILVIINTMEREIGQDVDFFASQITGDDSVRKFEELVSDLLSGDLVLQSVICRLAVLFVLTGRIVCARVRDESCNQARSIVETLIDQIVRQLRPEIERLGGYESLVRRYDANQIHRTGFGFPNLLSGMTSYLGFGGNLGRPNLTEQTQSKSSNRANLLTSIAIGLGGVLMGALPRFEQATSQ